LALCSLAQPLCRRTDAAFGEVARWHHFTHNVSIGKLDEAVDPIVPLLRHAEGSRRDCAKDPFSLCGCGLKVAVKHAASLIALVSAFHPLRTFADGKIMQA